MVKNTIVFTLAFIAISSSLAVFSQDDEENTQNESSHPSQHSHQSAYLDPETGELTSTPPAGSVSGSDERNVSASVNLPPVQIITHSNGTVEAQLNGRFRTPLMATIGCDGQITTEHVEETSHQMEECEAKQ